MILPVKSKYHISNLEKRIYKKSYIAYREKEINCDTFTKENNIQFNGKSCSPHNFELRNIHNIRCPYCNRITLNKKEIETFKKEIEDKRGKELVNCLEKYEDERSFVENGRPQSVFRPQKQEVVSIIKNLAQEYPNLYLDEIVQLQAQRYLKPLIVQQLAVVDELEKYIENSDISKEELTKLYEVIAIQKEKILGRHKDDFKRKGFIYNIANCVSREEVQSEIDHIVAKLPTSNNNIESFFVKYSKPRYTSSLIAEKLLYGVEPTTEHLVPRYRKSKGHEKGRNNIANYIVDCAECNGKKGTTPFKQWAQANPDFAKNLQEYINTMQKEINTKGKYSSYATYIDDIIKTIKHLSQGEILLYNPNSIAESLD